MIRFDDQPPMSPAADKWANSALKKSEKYRDKDASNLSYYGKNKHQRLYELPKIINKENQDNKSGCRSPHLRIDSQAPEVYFFRCF